jgi:predicted metal-dependent hydrolase
MNAFSVRHPRFAVSGPDSLDWLAGDAFRSQFFNSFSMLFPIGERYFIESLTRAVDQIDDLEVKLSVKVFIGQESSHRRIHVEYNRSLERLGLTNIAEHFLQWRIDHSRWLSPLDHVAITAGVEHFTTVIGEGLLANDDWLAGASPELDALWRWHAAEEVEHGWIPLSVYEQLGGGYLRRILWFFYVCVTLLLDIGLQTVLNLRNSKQLWRIQTWRQGLAFLFGRKGPACYAIAAVPRYLRPHYTRSRPGLSSLAKDWLSANAQRFTRTQGSATDELAASPEQGLTPRSS